MKIKTTLLSITCMIFSLSAFSQTTLQWEELGPTNTGGRTRAILVDKRDPTRATVYAGMVSGGLWKSTDRGATWHQLLSVYTCAAVTCLAQDSNGRIYFGTGEGLSDPSGSSRSSGSVGNGLHFLYGNDQDSIIPSTMPAYLSSGQTWSMINRIAINPNNPDQILAATSGSLSTSGLQQSMNGGQTWTLVGSAALPITGLAAGYNGAADVKFSADGSFIFASVGNISGAFIGRYLILSQDGGNTFSYVNDSSFAANTARIEIGTAPSDANIAYISIATETGFGGVWKTLDGGSSWTEVGAAGGVLSSVFGTDGQGWYDNAISVCPGNADSVYLGGITLYSYSSLTGWTAASIYNGNPSNPDWVQADIQTIVFNDLNGNEMYVGCDGGIFKSSNASSSFPSPTYAESNSGYNTVQMYSVASDLYGNVFGGTQGDGNIQVNIDQGIVVQSAGNGSYAEISHFDSSILIGGYSYGQEYRTDSRGNAWIGIYDNVIDPQNSGSPTICGQQYGNAPFVTPFWLVETSKAANSAERVAFVDNVAHSAGYVATLTSHIGVQFQDTLTAALPAGDTAYFTDRLQSRLYLATNCGLWMTPGILNFGATPHWFRITTSNNAVLALAASPTGDTIYISNGGQVTRISGLNSVPFDTFSSGSNSIILTAFPQVQEATTQVMSSIGNIECIDVDKNNPSHVVCTFASFNVPGSSHVFESTDAGSTWQSIGNSLPDMPVYQVVIDAYNSSHYIVGSELGFWDTYDAGNTWNEQNGGIVLRDPVYRLRQQTYLSDQCYALYAGTHGRGMWRCTTLTEAQNGCTVIPLGVSAISDAADINRMQLYPNPMDGSGNVALDLAEASDVSLSIIDMPGRLLMQKTYSDLSAGKNILDLNTSGLSDGSYMVVARLSNGQTYSRTLIVAR